MFVPENIQVSFLSKNRLLTVITVMKTYTFVFCVILSFIYCVQALSADSTEEPSLNIPFNQGTRNSYVPIYYKVHESKGINCFANKVKDPVEWISPSGQTVGDIFKNRHVYVVRQERKDKVHVATLFINLGFNFTDSGIWTCKSGDLNDTIEISAAEKVIMPTEIEEIRADEGKNAILTCEAKGYPEPVVTWYKDDIWVGITIGISEDSKYEIRKKDNTYTLEIRRLKHADSGKYKCKVTQKKLSHYAEKFIKLVVYPDTFPYKV